MEMFHKVDVLKYIIQIRHKLAQLKESRSPTKVFFPSEAKKPGKSEAAPGIVVLVVVRVTFFVVLIDLFLGFFVSLLWVSILYSFSCVQLLLKTETA